MAEKKIPISEASKSDLRSFALTLGIPTLPTSWSREQVLSRIRTQYDEDYIVIDIDEPTRDTIANINRAAEAENSEFVFVEINVSELANGSDPVYVSVNGRGMLIPRGERVRIPKHFHEALKNAVMDVFDPLKEGGIAATPRKVPRFPHSVYSAAA